MRTFRARPCGKPLTLVVGWSVGALLAVGCTSDGDSTASVTPVDGSGAATVVAVHASFDIARIEVQASSTTTIVLDNRDTVGHTLTVYADASPESDVVADTGEIAGGERGEAAVFFSASGEHAFRCEIHPESMRGTLVVRD